MAKAEERTKRTKMTTREKRETRKERMEREERRERKEREERMMGKERTPSLVTQTTRKLLAQYAPPFHRRRRSPCAAVASSYLHPLHRRLWQERRVPRAE